MVLGDSLTLPNYVSGPQPAFVLNGSLRYNAQSGSVEVFASHAGSAPAWQALAAASGADLAERYHADAEYPAGTVLVIGGAAEVTISTEAGSRAVVGVVSTAPGLRLNADAGTDASHPYVALRGRVPVKVAGRVRRGEALMTSSLPGCATAATAWVSPLCIIGKALEDFDGATGMIEVLV